MKKRLSLMLALLFVLCLSGSAGAVDLAEVRQAIAAQGAGWQAGTTPLSQLTPEERLSRLGLEMGQGNEDTAAFSPPWADDLPAQFDWRNSGAVSPVTDQENCGSCWAFASVAALESVVLLEGLPTMDLSEQFLVSYSLLNRGCNGGSLWTAANFLKRIGTVDEACMPYRANGRKLPLPCSEWRTDRFGTVDWYPITQDVEALKAAVYEAPVAVGFWVYEDFYYYESGVYSYVSGDLVGGHAVLIVGWDDSQQCFIVKNSWGPDWGEGGFFRIAYTQVTNEVAFGQDAILLEGLWPLL